jgi:hypothetical protein
MSFSFNTNLSGIRAAGSGSKLLPLVEGYWEGKIIECYPKTSASGREMAEFKVECTSGDYAGNVRTTRINLPQSDTDPVRYYWRALMESIGYGAAQLDAGSVAISADLIVGRSCTFYYKPGDRDAGIWDVFNFLAPGDWKRQAGAFNSAKAVQVDSSVASPLSEQIDEVASAPLKGQSVNANDLLSALGA